MKNWVSIKKGEQVITKIPYQAFKDVFEKDGFEIVTEENLNDGSILSLYADNKKGHTSGVKKKIVDKDTEIKKEAEPENDKTDTSRTARSSNRKRKE